VGSHAPGTAECLGLAVGSGASGPELFVGKVVVGIAIFIVEIVGLVLGSSVPGTLDCFGLVLCINATGPAECAGLVVGSSASGSPEYLKC